jgi:hypothetical protein
MEFYKVKFKQGSSSSNASDLDRNTQFIQVNNMTVPLIRSCPSLPRPFQFNIHLLHPHLTIHRPR